MGSNFFHFFVFLTLFLPLWLVYELFVPLLTKARLKIWWEKVGPKVAPYLSFIYIIFCIMVLPALGLYFLRRGH